MKYFILLAVLYPLFAFSQDGVKPIIDVHLHGYTERSYRAVPGAPPNVEEFRKAVREQLRKYNIVATVKSGGEFDPEMEEKMIQGYESNNVPNFDTVEFKKLIREGKIQVWGEFMPQFHGMTLADPKFAPYLTICEREGIPIALHTGSGPPGIYRQYPDYRLKLGDPMLIEEVLIKYPGLKIYLMHSGIPFYESTLYLIEMYPQVYTDLGAVLWVDFGLTPSYAEEFLKQAKKGNFIDRVMFGSDVMYWAYRIGESIEKLDSYDFLTEDDKRKIFYHNAVKFFDLETGVKD